MTTVRLWLQSADVDTIAAQDRSVLSDAELARAERFRFDRDRAAFVRSHALLRRVVGRLLGELPERLPLECRAHEPPLLRCDGAPSLSLSRSNGWVVVAACENAAVGVDLEATRTLDDVSALAESALTPDERAWWAAAPAEARSARFLRLWTMKEAAGKSLGHGLTPGPRMIRCAAPGWVTTDWSIVTSGTGIARVGPIDAPAVLTAAVRASASTPAGGRLDRTEWSADEAGLMSAEARFE